MNVSIITLVIFLLMQSVMICTAHAAASIGSDIKNIQKIKATFCRCVIER